MLTSAIIIFGIYFQVIPAFYSGLEALLSRELLCLPSVETESAAFERSLSGQWSGVAR